MAPPCLAKISSFCGRTGVTSLGHRYLGGGTWRPYATQTTCLPARLYRPRKTGHFWVARLHYLLESCLCWQPTAFGLYSEVFLWIYFDGLTFPFLRWTAFLPYCDPSTQSTDYEKSVFRLHSFSDFGRSYQIQFEPLSLKHFIEMGSLSP